MKINGFIKSNRRYVVLVIMLFFGLKIYGQDGCYNVFRNESVNEFKKMNYQKAIDNLKVASSCEDKPKKNDIYELIDKYQRCIHNKSEGDKLLAENKYEIALYFYQQLAEINPEDTHAQTKITECEEKLRCFPETRNQGNILFRQSKYNEAMLYFEKAQKCDVKPFYNDIGLLTENIKQCLYFKNRADSLLALKDYKGAFENYTNVLTLNPGDSYCREQMTKIPSEFEQFIEKPIKRGWFATLNFSFRNIAPFYDNRSFKTGDGFLGITAGKMNSWGYYGSLMLGSSSLWNLKSYSSSKYLAETGIPIAYVFKDGDYIPSIEDQIYLVEGEVLIHKYPDFTRRTNISFSAGITKRIINKEKFKMHLTAGFGWANWGAEQENYLDPDRVYFEPNEPRLYHFLNGNNVFETIQLSEYWVKIEDGAYLYNFKSAPSWEAGFMFNYYRFTLNMNTSFMFEGKDKKHIDTYNQMITIGLGYSW